MLPHLAVVPPPVRLVDVLRLCVRHPVKALVRRWNYKAAVTSAGVRSALFLVTNLTAGPAAATTAAVTEFCYRLATAGFYGALTQHFGQVTPHRVGWLAAVICLPLLGHGGELLVHWWRGTPNLGASLIASVGLTVLSTSFNLFAMRRGVLVVGVPGRPGLLADLRVLPGLGLEFAVEVGTSGVRGLAAGARGLAGAVRAVLTRHRRRSARRYA
jgi:hypothetical protein